METNLIKRKIFIWDFHDTLETGTLDIITEIANTLLEENGSDVKYNPNEIAAMPSFSWAVFFRRHFADFSDQKICEIAESAYDEKRFGHLSKKYSRANENALNILQIIKERGHLNFIISNSKQEKLGYYIDLIGVGEFIDDYRGIDDGAIVSKDDVTAKKLSTSKMILSRYDHGDVYAVGDSNSDFEVAKALGVKNFFWVLSDETKKSATGPNDGTLVYITDLLSIKTVLD